MGRYQATRDPQKLSEGNSLCFRWESGCSWNPLSDFSGRIPEIQKHLPHNGAALGLSAWTVGGACAPKEQPAGDPMHHNTHFLKNFGATGALVKVLSLTSVEH